MKIKTAVPPTLPLRSIKWEAFADLLGKAHAAVARYDEIIKSAENRQAVLSILTAEESLDSVESKKTKTRLIKILKHPGNRKLSGDAENLLQILNYRAALAKGKKRIEDHPFSGALLCELHGTIRKGAHVAKKDIGRWRDRQNWIGPEGKGKEEAYYFPPTLSVMFKKLDNWLKYVRSKDKDPLVQIAIAFAQLLAIHPFMDANGRVARALIPLFLYKKKVTSCPIVYLSKYFKKNRFQYFNSLYAVNSKHRWEEWIRFFLEGIIEECEDNAKEAKKILKKV